MTEHVFTDDEIRQIIDVINRTKHTQYIGARYVPIFGRVGEDSTEWDNSAPYEPLTIVLHQGNSYTSRQYVPAGVEITNEKYWANTGNYNAQVEQYRQEVAAFDERITEAKETADNANGKLSAMGVNTVDDGTDLLHRVEDIDTRSALNREKIKGINDNLTALGADTVPKSTAINEQLKGLAPDKYAPNTHAIFIGDSITQGWNGTKENNWTTRLCETFKWTKHSYAVGGSGFNPANHDYFKAQVERAIADTSFNHNEVGYIFVSGGINDGAPTGETLQACTNTAADICNLLKANFPNAKIYSVIGLCALMDATKHSTATAPLAKRISYYNSLARIFTAHNIPCIANAWRWLLTNPSYCDDGLHPNDAGYNIVQGYYEEIVKNTYSDNTYETRVPEYNGITKCSDNVTSVQTGIINTSTTATIFGTAEYHKNENHPLDENDTISSNGSTISLNMINLPPNLRSPFDTYMPVVVSVNSIIYTGYAQLKYDLETKTEKIRVNLTVKDYNFNTNNWTLIAYWNYTIPVYGITS